MVPGSRELALGFDRSRLHALVDLEAGQRHQVREQHP
jgi:hypothetical protein